MRPIGPRFSPEIAETTDASIVEALTRETEVQLAIEIDEALAKVPQGFNLRFLAGFSRTPSVCYPIPEQPEGVLMRAYLERWNAKSYQRALLHVTQVTHFNGQWTPIDYNRSFEIISGSITNLADDHLRDPPGRLAITTGVLDTVRLISLTLKQNTN